MKSKLQIIQQDNLYGLSDTNNHEVVECIYNQIKPIKSGKFIVIKDEMAGILSNEGTILLHLQHIRLKCIEEIDIFRHKIDDKKIYFKFIDNQIYYLDIDRLYYNKKDRLIVTQKGEITKFYNDNLSLIHTGFDTIYPDYLIQGGRRFYLGTKNGKWGVFRIKFVPKHDHTIITKIEPQYNTYDEALKAIKNSIKKRNISRIQKEQI